MAKRIAPRATRKKTDTAEQAVQVMQNALRSPLKPPAHVTVTKDEMPFWNSLVRTRARDLWTVSDLENLANLASCKASIERVRRELRKEGEVIENGKGTPIMNPKLAVLEQLSRRCMAMSRMLHVHAEATGGRSAEEAPAAAAERAAAAALEMQDDGDDLFARPPVH